MINTAPLPPLPLPIKRIIRAFFRNYLWESDSPYLFVRIESGKRHRPEAWVRGSSKWLSNTYGGSKRNLWQPDKNTANTCEWAFGSYGQASDICTYFDFFIFSVLLPCYWVWVVAVLKLELWDEIISFSFIFSITPYGSHPSDLFKWTKINLRMENSIRGKVKQVKKSTIVKILFNVSVFLNSAVLYLINYRRWK